MNINDLKAAGYVLHHTATARGYVSRKGGGVIKPYNGRFGAGYVHLRPRWDTSAYVYIDYYIKEV